MSDPVLTDTPKPATWYSVTEVVELFDGYVSDEMIYRLVREERVPGIRFERRVIVLRDSIDALIDQVKAGAFVDLTTWDWTTATPKTATPAPALLPQVPGSRAAGEEVA